MCFFRRQKLSQSFLLGLEELHIIAVARDFLAMELDALVHFPKALSVRIGCHVDGPLSLEGGHVMAALGECQRR